MIATRLTKIGRRLVRILEICPRCKQEQHGGRAPVVDADGGYCGCCCHLWPENERHP